MKFKNLPEAQHQILREKHARSCEVWAKNPTLHPTVDTYTEAYFKGCKAALLLPVIPFKETATLVAGLTLEGKDREWTERAWKALMHGGAKTVEDALKLTEKAEPPIRPDPDEKTPPVGPQEPGDPDQEDMQ